MNPLAIFLPQTVTERIQHQPFVMLRGLTQLQQQVMDRFPEQTMKLVQVPGTYRAQGRIGESVPGQRPPIAPAQIRFRTTAHQRRGSIVHVQLAGRAQ